MLLLSLAVTARATVYTLSQQGLLSLDVIENSGALSVTKTPVTGGVEYLVTFGNFGYYVRDWSYRTSEKGLLTGLPIVAGDSRSVVPSIAGRL